MARGAAAAITDEGGAVCLSLCDDGMWCLECGALGSHGQGVMYWARCDVLGKA